jgi:hypothetical protein
LTRQLLLIPKNRTNTLNRFHPLILVSNGFWPELSEFGLLIGTLSEVHRIFFRYKKAVTAYTATHSEEHLDRRPKTVCSIFPLTQKLP